MSNVIAPLIWDGSTLSIPQASSTQDGYVSRDTFILFSGGTVVPVTSFNNRTGEIILWEDDVLAALGYVPLNKHGDTMTGPLMLSGSPSAGSPALQAATKAYVDSGPSGTGLPPGVYAASNFNASGSARRFTGAITLGSRTLTLSSGSAVDFQIGQGILITGGAGGGVDLLTKVDAVAGLVITLHDPAAITNSSVNVQHDDSVALNTAIAYVLARQTTNGTVRGGTLLLDGDFYRVNGPFTDFNSILKIPLTPGDSTHPNVAIKIVGYIPNRMPGFLGPPGESVVIQTDKIGTSFESWMLSAGPAFNSTTLYLQDLTFRTYLDPAIGGIDVRQCQEPSFQNVCVDIGASGTTGAPPLPTHNRAGVRLCTVNITGLCWTQNLWVGGYDIGIIANEEWVAPYVGVAFCNTGILFEAGFHMSGPIRATVFWCRTFCQWTGRLTVEMTLDTEIEPVRLISGRVLYDPNNNAYGTIRYFGQLTGSGVLTAPDFTGCAHLCIDDLNGFQSKEPSREIDSLAITSQPVTFGLTDSGGAGFRNVLVPNVPILDPLWAGLLSYWNMNEGDGPRLDQKGNNTLTSAATSRAGLYGQAAGGVSGDFLYCPSNPTQVISGSMSIAGWVQIHSLAGGSGYHTLLAKWGASGACSFLLTYNNTSGHWEFLVSQDGTGSVPTSYKASVAAAPPTIDTWYFVSAVYDADAHEIRLRINDGAVGSNTVFVPFTGALFNPSSAVALGCMVWASNTGDLSVEELGWWTRALTLAQITQLYNAGNGLTYPLTTIPSTLLKVLTSYWNLDETGSGARIDKVGANHFTPVGAPAAHAGITAGLGSVSSAGGTAYLKCLQNASQKFDGSVTIAGWVAVHNYTTNGGFHTILSKWNGSPGYSAFWLLWRNDTGKFEVNVTADGNVSGIHTVSITNTPALEAWVFVCFVYDHAASQIKLSINNGAFATASFTGPIWYSATAGIDLQCMNSGASTGDMSVDEMGMWHRVLTTTEITNLWNSGTGRTYPFA